MAFKGENAIGQVDPTTLEVNYFPLPHEDTFIRRLDIASDGTIWYVNSSRGKLGHLGLNTGEVREWDSPGGLKSHPFAIAVIDAIVWYNKSGQRADSRPTLGLISNRLAAPQMLTDGSYRCL